jgi:hypothetical protein
LTIYLTAFPTYQQALIMSKARFSAHAHRRFSFGTVLESKAEEFSPLGMSQYLQPLGLLCLPPHGLQLDYGKDSSTQMRIFSEVRSTFR